MDSQSADRNRRKRNCSLPETCSCVPIDVTSSAIIMAGIVFVTTPADAWREVNTIWRLLNSAASRDCLGWIGIQIERPVISGGMSATDE